ncbi:MAG: DUF1223 domain-containing protein [Alphaproteobacteria bacterium]|nr:DUF1223 domain-containing protein [Alphaproteobacteria bacterium]
MWLVRFDRHREVTIERGENSGKTLLYSNVVADRRRIGEWNGGSLDLSLSLTELREGDRDGVAVVVREGNLGRVLAVATYDLTSR